ncbi:MAG: LacI family DNA-binding transcriptional regulator [Acidimicrobiia bacterium]
MTTIKDVAEVAGVSSATVSRVLNARPSDAGLEVRCVSGEMVIDALHVGGDSLLAEPVRLGAGESLLAKL